MQIKKLVWETDPLDFSLIARTRIQDYRITFNSPDKKIRLFFSSNRQNEFGNILRECYSVFKAKQDAQEHFNDIAMSVLE